MKLSYNIVSINSAMCSKDVRPQPKKQLVYADSLKTFFLLWNTFSSQDTPHYFLSSLGTRFVLWNILRPNGTCLSSRQYVGAIKHGLQLIRGIEIAFWTRFGHIFGNVFQHSGLDKRQNRMRYLLHWWKDVAVKCALCVISREHDYQTTEWK